MISDEDFLQLIEKYDVAYKKGDIVQGHISGYDGDNVLVDINAKACAICPKQEILTSKGDDVKEILKLDETYEFIINYPQDEDGVYYLSHKKVALKQNIEILSEKFKNNETLQGKISNLTKGGILVNVMGLKGFMPLSQIKIENYKVGDEIELKIIALDMEQNNFILSNKKVYEEEILTAKMETLQKVELNMVVKGKVVRLTDFGAFIDIGGIDGLLPLSQISWRWLDKPSDVLSLGDVIDVEIIGIDKEKQRISLSLKTLEDNPWIEAQEIVKKDAVIKGRVTGVKTFGIFVEVYPKVEGLVSKTEFKEFLKKYNKELNIGDEIEVLIKNFDAENQKIVLEVV